MILFYHIFHVFYDKLKQYCIIMKPIVERLNREAKSSFVLQKDIYPYYPTPWHFHPEYELVLVVKSTGEKIIGDHISNFSDDDLAFLGPYLPHVYHNDNIYFEKDSTLTAEAIVIHFTHDFLGRSFFDIPEMRPVKTLLEDSVRGFAVSGSTRKIIAQKMKAMFSMEGPARIIELLTILKILAHSADKLLLSSPGFIQNFKTSGSDRIKNVCDFIMKNFASDLTLDEIARVANMSPNAFCHFFKNRTRKTFVNFLNEVRVGYACKLLTDDRYNISEICYQSGFQNLSNFNRQFKRIVHKTPNQYKLDILRINL